MNETLGNRRYNDATLMAIETIEDDIDFQDEFLAIAGHAMDNNFVYYNIEFEELALFIATNIAPEIPLIANADTRIDVAGVLSEVTKRHNHYLHDVFLDFCSKTQSKVKLPFVELDGSYDYYPVDMIRYTPTHYEPMTASRHRITGRRPALIIIDDLEVSLNQPSTYQEPTFMSNQTFETVTYLNGQDVNKMSEDDLLYAIQRAEEDIKRLDEIGVESTKIAKRKAEIEALIAKIVKVLDDK